MGTRTLNTIASIPPRPMPLLHWPTFLRPQETQFTAKALLPTALPFPLPLNILLLSTFTTANPTPLIHPHFHQTPFPVPSLIQQITATTGLNPTFRPRQALPQHGPLPLNINSTSLRHTRLRSLIQVLDTNAGQTTSPNLPPTTATTTEASAVIYLSTRTQWHPLIGYSTTFLVPTFGCSNFPIRTCENSHHTNTDNMHSIKI